MRWIVPCPAKLNLFLAVGPVDRRGYHPLRTIFQAVSIFDVLTIELSDRNEAVCSDPSVPDNNTVSRTLRLLAEIVNLPPLKVEITKGIPSESGLGGGSTDAAGLIRAAEVISNLPIPRAEMFGLAQTIGADVPFFLVGGKAKAEGYGESLTPLDDPASDHYLVLRPNVGCPTKEMFAALDQKSYAWREFPGADDLYNDFERVAPCESLDLIERLQSLGARDAALTGSGSAVFGRFRSREAAAIAYEQMESQRIASWLCQPLSRAESLRVDVEP